MRKVKIDKTFILVLLFAIASIVFSRIIPIKIFNRIFIPGVWCLLAIYACKVDGRYFRFKNKTSNYKSVLIFILLYIVLYFSSGLIFEFAYTPYSHSFRNIILNIWQVIIPIICMEIVRNICINKNRENFLFIAICTIIFIILELNVTTLVNATRSNEELFTTICSVILPLIMSNVMYSYYCLQGSFKLVLIYRLPLELLFLIVPVFPNHDWFVKACFGVIAPIFFIIILKHFSEEHGFRTQKTRKRESVIGYLPIFIICILLVLFMTGVFKYEPVAIASNSMVPVFSRGDVVIYEKMSIEELKNIEKDTIIIYNRDGSNIVHRVIESGTSDGKVVYLTKGDANNTDDGIPVEVNQIIGKYKFHIKYIGFPSIWLNDLLK